MAHILLALEGDDDRRLQDDGTTYWPAQHSTSPKPTPISLPKGLLEIVGYFAADVLVVSSCKLTKRSWNLTKVRCTTSVYQSSVFWEPKKQHAHPARARRHEIDGTMACCQHDTRRHPCMTAKRHDARHNHRRHTTAHDGMQGHDAVARLWHVRRRHESTPCAGQRHDDGTSQLQHDDGTTVYTVARQLNGRTRTEQNCPPKQPRTTQHHAPRGCIELHLGVSNLGVPKTTTRHERGTTRR